LNRQNPAFRIASGRIYDEEYYEVAKPGGGSIWIERVEIGGQLVGYMVSEEMTPGTAYSETTRRDVNDPDNTEEPYSSWTSLPCYAAGTLIETEFGQTPIEDIRPATRVRTHDAGLVPVIWVGHRHISTRMQAADHRLRPVKISKGALGGHEPADDLIVSPQHRILLHTRDEISAPLKGIFAPAKGLINVQGIRLTSGKKPVTYHHLLCRSHQIIRANGCWSETLFPGAVAFEMLGQLAARDITKLLGRSLTTYTLARPCLTVREARDLYHSDDAHTPMKRARHRPVQNHSDPSNLIC